MRQLLHEHRPICSCTLIDHRSTLPQRGPGWWQAVPQGHSTGPSRIMPLPQLKQPILHTGTHRFSSLTVPKPIFPDGDLQRAPCLSSSGHFPQRCLTKAQQRGPLPPQPQELPGSQAHLRGTAPGDAARASWPSDTPSQTSGINPDTQQWGKEGTPGPAMPLWGAGTPWVGPAPRGPGAATHGQPRHGDEAAVWRVTREGRAGPGTPRRRDRAAPQPPPTPGPLHCLGLGSPWSTAPRQGACAAASPPAAHYPAASPTAPSAHARLGRLRAAAQWLTISQPPARPSGVPWSGRRGPPRGAARRPPGRPGGGEAELYLRDTRREWGRPAATERGASTLRLRPSYPDTGPGQQGQSECT